MKIALYDPYLDTVGGGERYIATIAEDLSLDNEVYILWDDNNIIAEIESRLKLNLSRVKIIPDPFLNKYSNVEKYRQIRRFDRLLFLSDGSFPFGFAKQNFLHFQFPVHWIDGKTFTNKFKLQSYKNIICNSLFTKKFIDKTYGINSIVVYPPVDIDQFTPQKKEKIIISVGRFTKSLHNKRQDILIEAFKKLINKGVAGWQLIIAGAIDPKDNEMVKELKEMIQDYPILIKPNISFEELKNLYGIASIYWHGAGFNIDSNKEPEKTEHFGITIVEAMSAGCVPLVVANGGQTEIVESGISGETYSDEEELVNKTLSIINDNTLFNKLAVNAKLRSKLFGKERFCSEIKAVLNV